MCFFDLGDSDDSKWSCCCGCLHIYIGTWCFLVQDFFVMWIFTLTYKWALENNVHWTNVIPMCAYVVSWCFVIVGWVGFFLRRPLLLTMYAIRTALVAAFCLMWTLILYNFVEGGFTTTLLTAIWLLGCPVYAHGGYTAYRCAKFLNSCDFDFGEPKKDAPKDSDRESSSDEDENENPGKEEEGTAEDMGPEGDAAQSEVPQSSVPQTMPSSEMPQSTAASKKTN